MNHSVIAKNIAKRPWTRDTSHFVILVHENLRDANGNDRPLTLNLCIGLKTLEKRIRCSFEW